MIPASRVRSLGVLLPLALLLAVFAPARTHAVILDGMNQCVVKLSDGTDVVLYGEFVSKLSVATRGDEANESSLVPVGRARKVGIFEMQEVASRRAGEFDAAHNAARAQQDQRWSDLQREFEQEKERFKKEIEAGKKFRPHVKSNRFHYLPPNNALHLSKRPDGTPEFLFVRYTTDKKESEGGAQGGLIHFLMELSLTKIQEEELRQLVRRNCKGDSDGDGVGDGTGELVGSVEISEAEEKGSFQIVSAILADSGMTRSRVQSGHAPVLPGGKLAAAANLSANGAQLFLSTVDRRRGSIADLSVELNYAYVVQLPAAKGAIFFDWSKMEKAASEYLLKYDSKWDDDDDDLTVSKTQLESFMSFAMEQSVVEFIFEGYQPDSEFSKTLLEAMTDFFLESMMKAQDEDGDALSALNDDDEEGTGKENIKEAQSGKGEPSETHYNISKRKLSQSFKQKSQVIKLEAGLAAKKTFTVVGNLASWYDGVKDNPRCVTSVNLNDPFFQHRDIRFILDLDAKDIFEKMVNYATVNVRKRRSNGSEFNDSLTIDAEYLRTKGIAGTLTYARMDDTNTEAYEYMTQWSVRGGNIYPARPRWLKGAWEGVTLAPPIEEWTIEAEGDVPQMEASNIARVSIEIHYPTFGEEQTKVIALSPKTGDEIKTEKIYVDRGTRGFAYRLIVHHKTEGRMVLPWQTRIGERYVYATLPEDILVAGDPREQAKAAAKKLGQMGAEKVLDKFEELFSGAD